jgi:hypothetical protein
LPFSQKPRLYHKFYLVLSPKKEEQDLRRYRNAFQALNYLRYWLFLFLYFEYELLSLAAVDPALRVALLAA